VSKIPGVLPWSYSSLTAFETCPRRYHLTRITKEVREAQTEATTHGNEVHKAMELHIKGEKPMPEKYAAYRKIAERAKMEPGKKLVEFKFGLTASFRPTEFFAKDVWCRGVIDYAAITPKSASVLDWKTGKPKVDTDQLKLFAAVTFATNPYITSVKTGYIWLGHGKISVEKFKKEDTPAIWNEFTPRVIRMVKAQEQDRFPPNPSGLCKNWCPVPNSKCEFSGKN
jgi:hypothetical protein